jgi:prophage antirepressor-like protein
MTNIQIFESPEFGAITTAIIDGREYFAATECARALGYANPEEAIREHCKGVSETLTIKKPVISHGQDTGTTRDVPVKFISEGNLFRLIVKSHLPEAEKFERLVFDEILPTIRKTGTYHTVDHDQLEQERLENSILRQKLQVFEEHSAAKFYDYDEAAALCAYYRKPPFGREHLKRWLVSNKILCKQAAKNEKPIQYFLDNGWFVAVIHEWYRKGKRHTENRYYMTPKGLMGVIDRMIRANLLQVPVAPQRAFPQVYMPSSELCIADHTEESA